MKRLFQNFFASVPLATRIFLFLFMLSFPVAWIGHRLHLFELYDSLALNPALVWKGQVWRVFTYAFLPYGPVDWMVSSFWLATLVSLLGRNWSGLGFWTYNLLAALSGATWFLLLAPHLPGQVVGAGAMIFALLIAWDRIYKNERLLLLGIGEVSVRQAVILVAIIDSVIMFFCCGGWFYMVGMWCGGAFGAAYFLVRGKRIMRGEGQALNSERIARLEL
jgi:membrane associated rhomboid family serine protease